MKMTFSIPEIKKYTPPQPTIQIQNPNLANVKQNPILVGSIFQTIYNTGPCTSCGK
jgi:hypothetical protein